MVVKLYIYNVKMKSEDGQVYSVYVLQFSCFPKYAVKA